MRSKSSAEISAGALLSARELEELLRLHLLTMKTMTGYACIDAYAGEGQEQHLQRMMNVMAEG